MRSMDLRFTQKSKMERAHTKIVVFVSMLTTIYFCMASEVHHGPDRSFSSTNPAMSSLVQRISEVNEEVRKGTRTTNRENDVLTQALRNKEHPGRTRGASLVPWKIAFEEESSTYWSRSRGRVAQEAEYMRVLKQMEDKFKK